MIIKLRILFLIGSMLFFANIINAETPIVAVGKAGLEKKKITIQLKNLSAILVKEQKDAASQIAEIFRSDFSYYRKVFEVSTLSDGSSLPKDGVFIELSFIGNPESLKYNIKVSKPADKSDLLSSSGEVLEDEAERRRQFHRVADDIYQKIIGKESIFKTTILFVSDRISPSLKNSIKELYRMDFDGKNKERLTFHKGIVVSPAISYDGKKALYSLIPNSKNRKRNINLYMLDLETKKRSLVSSKKGINSGAVFTPDDQHIMLTLTKEGNAEIYKMNLISKKLIRLTRHFAADVDPSITRKGDLMAFLSGRPGKAMIYTMEPTGLENKTKRISYVGKFNATPRFSPDGSNIVFSSWMDNKFDIFRVNADGSALGRLTKDFGSNEDPSYANDGQFIAFSSLRVLSKRRASQNIYIMDQDGEILGNLTNNFGNCITPRWSK